MVTRFKVSASAGAAKGDVALGRFNNLMGGALLLVGFGAATWLDPWSLRERDPSLLIGSARMAARLAQAVVVAMAFLQLIVAGALTTVEMTAGARRGVSWLTGWGALLYAAGYILASSLPDVIWLIPTGALLNFLGFALLLVQAGGARERWLWRVTLSVVCLGMLLDLAIGLFVAKPRLFLPAFLGPDDGVRLRMLRLARAAAIALPAVALLYEGLADRVQHDRLLFQRGRAALWCGVASMSAILAAASFTNVAVKYLLPLPALTLFAGTCVAGVLAYRHASRLEVWGWLLVALSMGTGLVMGLYAFDGPLPAPPFLGVYNDFARRLSRLGHAYCIVLGLLSIFLARESEKPCSLWCVSRSGVVLTVTGTVLTLAMILLAASSFVSTTWLAVGPAVVTLALLVCLAPAGVHSGSERG
jgi:hypothetical protein